MLRNNKVLWTLQILLAALYLFAGGFKLVASPEQMSTPGGPTPSANMILFLRMIGGFEVLGAAGLILPGVTGIKRHLTSVAAGCLAIIMVGAVVVSIAQIGVTAAIMPLVAGILDLVVMSGRRGWK